ncbi:Mbeg1-like protein [Peptostreptococcus canis]|uniref:DUF2974 domain-containing protein n=1 Tax=Peptostreptococcus canis TaxID=1159213 RepID=A0ABR6TNG7_9FIRM|nr:Mbeg1-like protein [Peptostreptococcus canis]MBC2576714.1 DUF2974 domain-containing protein [Peptostreptococcus canis]MBP1998437.1 hypothetical protein [Peptostreptococcus canis]
MDNIMDYLNWRGDLTFEQDEINEVDNLIFCELSYLNINTSGGSTLEEVANRYFQNDTLNEKERKSTSLITRIEGLLRKASNTNRFRKVVVSDFISKFDEIKEVQFCAMCFKFKDDSIYIAFRGTDDTLVGFKEDFNMSFSTSIYGQEYSAKYLRSIMKKYKKEKIFVGGHSKGGNFAVYSVMGLDDKNINRVEIVYNNDGPGFSSEVVISSKYKKTVKKVKKIMPKSSVVGILMKDNENRKLINAIGSTGFIQHDGFNWEVKGNKFVEEKRLTKDIVFIDKTLKHWLENTSDEEKAAFVDEFYELIIKTTKAKRISEISNKRLKVAIKILMEMSDLEPEKRELMLKMISQFVKSGSQIIKSQERKKKNRKRFLREL